jgi:hypothetical protein
VDSNILSGLPGGAGSWSSAEPLILASGSFQWPPANEFYADRFHSINRLARILSEMRMFHHLVDEIAILST